MPIFDYECVDCGTVFEVIATKGTDLPQCVHCGSHKTRKLMAPVAVHIKEDRATDRISNRVKEYLKDGKVSDARRFADKAATMVKSDKVKRIAEKLHHKTGQ